MFRCAPQVDNSDQRSRSIPPAALVFLGKSYPANDAPGVEVARELALVFVARDQHDDAPIVDVLEVDGGCGTQIAREGLCGLEHHLLADPRLGDLFFRIRGAGPLPIHHGFLLFARTSPASVGYLYRKPLALRRAFRLTRAASETPRAKRRPKDGAALRIGRTGGGCDARRSTHRF